MNKLNEEICSDSKFNKPFLFAFACNLAFKFKNLILITNSSR